MGELVPSGFGFHFTLFLFPLGTVSFISCDSRRKMLRGSSISCPQPDGHCLAVICHHPVMNICSGYRPVLMLDVRDALRNEWPHKEW